MIGIGEKHVGVGGCRNVKKVCGWEMMMIGEDCRGDNTKHSTVRHASDTSSTSDRSTRPDPTRTNRPTLPISTPARQCRSADV